MVLALGKPLVVIWPPVLGWLFAWVWLVNDQPLWVGLTVGAAGMLATFAASPFALLAVATDVANHTGIRRALTPLHVIWIPIAPGIGLALLTALIIGLFRDFA